MEAHFYNFMKLLLKREVTTIIIPENNTKQ